MNPFARYPRRAAACAAMLLLAACTDRSPVSPQDPRTGPGTGEPGRPVYLVAVTCQVDLTAAAARCTPAQSDSAGASRALVLGGQGRYINLEPGSVDYNPASQSWNINMSLRNLVPQPLGTTDGTTLDPNGVRVFLQAGPYIITGNGTVGVTPDGHGTFTAANQPYWQYNSVLDPFEVSPSRTWSFQVPATVTNFGFTAYVAAAVQFPDGWIDVAPEPITMHPHSAWKLTPTSRDAAGNIIPNQFFAWTSSDTTVVTVTPSGSGGGLLGSVRAGTVSINLTSGPRAGSAVVNVTGMQRVWEGDVSDNYFTGGNWTHGVVPVAQDTIIINSPSPNYPLLVQNAQIGGIQIAEGGLLNLASFDMTASRNVVSSTAGGTGIVSTTGRLFLTGVATTVGGRVPRLRVTGSVSLSANLWVAAPLQVDAGRITSTGFRIESNNTL